MFVIAQYMLSASTVFTRRPAKAVVCQLFQLLYLPVIQPWQMSSNSFLPSHNSSTSRSSSRGKCPLTPSAFS